MVTDVGFLLIYFRFSHNTGRTGAVAIRSRMTLNGSRASLTLGKFDIVH